MKRNIILVAIIITGLLSSAAISLWRAVPFSVDVVINSANEKSNALYDHNGVLFQVRLSKEGEWAIPVPLEKMGKWLPLVAVGVEDKRFYSHNGVDFLSLARAAWQNVASGKIVSGASTITSQVIRLTVTEKSSHRKRNFETKIIEFVQAMKLELEMPKEKILEIYLNNAPFGGNIRGVEAAARIYFGKSAANVSPGEACLLIGMLVAPTLHRPDINPESALRRRENVIAQLESRGVFDEAQARSARAEKIPQKRHVLPFRAYHYAMRLFRESGAKGRIETGLDINAQTALEKTLEEAVASMPGNITAAGGIIDNATGMLVAWVGNARFGRNVPGSWVDCGLALRSPGSALKTFAWVAAFDSGKITPSTLLADTPIAFSGRAPRNFDLTYRGRVSAHVALADSLNAPAVRVLRLAGGENVLGVMRGAGLASLTKGASYYGDSLILGGCDIRLSELLDAYSTIANGGERSYSSKFIFTGEQNKNTRKIFSPSAAWLVSEILSDTRRMSFVTREAFEYEGKKIAFKTGTSYGLRDAWTAAWNPRFTVAVWLGDPVGASWAQLVGLNSAAPAAFKVLRLVSSLMPDTSNSPSWFEVPHELYRLNVCTLSGKPPTAACPGTKNEWAIRDVTNILPCEFHFLENGKSRVSLPPELNFLSPGARRFDRKLEIVSPIKGGRYVVTSEQQKIPLRSEGGHGKIYWFVNGKFAGESSPVMPFFRSFPPGEHSVSAMDSTGQTASTKVNIVTLTPTKDEILKFE